MVKLYSSNSISGPSTTSYPIFVNIFSTSCNAITFGWLCPNSLLLAGSVTSMVSACSLALSASFESSFPTFSSVFSIASLASFTTLPNSALSSGAIFFIFLRSAVSSPFLPRYATLSSFNLSLFSALFIFSKASF